MANSISNDRRDCRYLIEATGRDSVGTSFQYFDGAKGWGPAAQAVSEMFRRVPGEAEITVYQGNPADGSFDDVTQDILVDAEVMFHKGVDRDNARATRSRARRTVSTYARQA